MTTDIHFLVERKSELLNRIGLSRSNLYNKINEGLWCPPISLGARAVGFLKHENDQLLAAMIAGKSNTEIKALVASLVMQRKDAMSAVQAS